MDIADRVRHLADAAAALGHQELSDELHNVARLEEKRASVPVSPESERLTEAILITLTELVRELARLRRRL